MRDRILKYLEEIGRPLPATDILQSVLNIRSPNVAAAERVLRGILRGDPRFRASRGLWQACVRRSGRAPDDFQAVFSIFIERGAAPQCPGCLRGALYASEARILWKFDLSPSAPSPDVRALRRMVGGARPGLLLTWGGNESRLWNELLQRWKVGCWPGRFLNLRTLAARVLARSAAGISPEQLASELAMPAPDLEQPAGAAPFFAACLPALLERVPEEHRRDLTALHKWMDEGRYAPDFSRFAFGRDYLRRLPASPGTYVMRNRAGDIIYVGKSRNLKRRVGSYFSAGKREDTKVAKILEQLHSLEVLPTVSEVEALLLEMRMIRDFRPPVNLQAEIHEQPAGYGKEQNLVLLVGEPGGARAQLYFLKEGVFVGQQSARLARPASSSLKKKLRSIYFGHRRQSGKRREPWEKEIVYRWLSANRYRLNFVDVGAAGSPDDALRQLDSYLLDPDRLARKVLYR